VNIDDALIQLARDEPWRADAACHGIDPDQFFPRRGDNVGAVQAVCRSCTVRVECLDYALAHSEVVGIWGGTGPRIRAAARMDGLDAPALLARLAGPGFNRRHRAA
jgi:WhiB family redox-sensing transcriptional regulator